MKTLMKITWYVSMGAGLIAIGAGKFDFAACCIGLAILNDLNPIGATS